MLRVRRAVRTLSVRAERVRGSRGVRGIRVFVFFNLDNNEKSVVGTVERKLERKKGPRD